MPTAPRYADKNRMEFLELGDRRRCWIHRNKRRCNKTPAFCFVLAEADRFPRTIVTDVPELINLMTFWFRTKRSKLDAPASLTKQIFFYYSLFIINCQRRLHLNT